MPVTTPSRDDYCNDHHCLWPEHRAVDKHTKSLRASDTLWEAVRVAAEAGRDTRNDAITEAIDAWLAIPDEQTDTTPEHGLGTRHNHTVRIAVPQQAAFEAKTARLKAARHGVTDSDCINAAMLQWLPNHPPLAEFVHARRAAEYSAWAAAAKASAEKIRIRKLAEAATAPRRRAPLIDPPQDAPEKAPDAAGTPEPAATEKKPATACTEPPAPVPAPRAEKAPAVAAAVRAARAAGHNVTTASKLAAVPAAPVFKAGPLVDCPHENLRGVKGVCPDCYQWVGGKR